MLALVENRTASHLFDRDHKALIKRLIFMFFSLRRRIGAPA